MSMTVIYHNDVYNVLMPSFFGAVTLHALYTKAYFGFLFKLAPAGGLSMQAALSVYGDTYEHQDHCQFILV